MSRSNPALQRQIAQLTLHDNHSFCLRLPHDKIVKLYVTQALLNQSNTNATLGFLKACCLWCICSARYCPQDALWRTKNCCGIFCYNLTTCEQNSEKYSCGSCQETDLLRYENLGDLFDSSLTERYASPPSQTIQ
jgi:hypothetical protein